VIGAPGQPFTWRLGHPSMHQRQLLLLPDDKTNNACRYCLIEAAQQCQIRIPYVSIAYMARRAAS